MTIAWFRYDQSMGNRSLERLTVTLFPPIVRRVAAPLAIPLRLRNVKEKSADDRRD